MTEFVMMIATALALADIALAATLLSVYYGLFRGVRAPVSLGLTLFSLFIMAQGIVMLVTYLDMLTIVPDFDALLLAGLTALEAVALVLLLRTART